jgi:NAD(P)-dependent dehydrogenase (short-subunit alcohol dehydrogenase family)
MTSVIGQIGNFGQANYAASKAGVAAMTKSLAKELAAKGMTANALAPGFMDTEMVSGIPDKVWNRRLDQIPLRRFGTAEEGRRLHHRRGAVDQRRFADVVWPSIARPSEPQNAIARAGHSHGEYAAAGSGVASRRSS